MTDREKQISNDLTFFMNTSSGRRTLARVMVAGGMFRTSFIPKDTGSVEFLEGRRSMALMLHDDLLKYCPKQMSILLGEMYDEMAKLAAPPKPVDRSEFE